MTGNQSYAPVSATLSATVSTLTIFVYFVIMVSIYPENTLRQYDIRECSEIAFQFFAKQQAILHQNQSTYPRNTSDMTEKLIVACSENIPVENLPSVSKAIDYWRGISAVSMAIPSGL